MKHRPTPEEYLDPAWFDTEEEYQEALQNERAMCTDSGHFTNVIEMTDAGPMAIFENQVGDEMQLNFMELAAALRAMGGFERNALTDAAVKLLNGADIQLAEVIKKGPKK